MRSTNSCVSISLQDRRSQNHFEGPGKDSLAESIQYHLTGVALDSSLIQRDRSDQQILQNKDLFALRCKETGLPTAILVGEFCRRTRRREVGSSASNRFVFEAS
jgi:hypothetical protein